MRGVALDDWDIGNSASFLINRVLTLTGNNILTDGQIYTGHDQPGQTNTIQALPEIVHELRSRGFGFMTLSELREHRNFTVSTGVTTYFNFFQNQPVITINTQPVAPPAENLVQGDISGSLTIAASATLNAVPAYQWYSNTTASTIGGTPVDGATSTTFAVPIDLTEGTYYFYCVVNATIASPTAAQSATAMPVASSVVTVTVTASPKTYAVHYDANGGTFPTNGGVDAYWSEEVLWAQSGLLPEHIPVRAGYELVGWKTEFGVDATNDMTYGELVSGINTVTSFTMLAQWELIPITSLRINAAIIETVARGGTYNFGVIVNEGAIAQNIIWTLSNPALGRVDEAGNVTIFERTGTVVLLATDPVSNISNSVMLRIAS